jgi:hypothetical protein
MLVTIKDIMFYTIYRITNNINGKFYVGTHKTKNINDSYMGSGKYLRHSQIKHGIENFSKEIIDVFDNLEQMFIRESEIVNKEFVADKNTYNLKLGGEGGWDHMNVPSIEKSHRSKLNMIKANNNGALTNAQKTLRWRRENDSEWVENKKKRHSDSIRKYYETNDGSFKGRKHTDDTKNKIGSDNSKIQKGEGNSQFNTRWIYSLEEKRSKKIKKNEPLIDGWFEGRKMNFGK